MYFHYWIHDLMNRRMFGAKAILMLTEHVIYESKNPMTLSNIIFSINLNRERIWACC